MSSPTCTVYFDGACPVCRTEIAHYQRQRGAEAINWVDASSCDEGTLGLGVDRIVLLRRFHVREADGSLASGAAAFVAIWRRLPAFAWLATLASFRPVLAVLDAGYAIFLRVRPTTLFIPMTNETLMRDIVRYRLPLGWLGSVVAGWKVESQVDRIFSYRSTKIAERFA